MNNSSKVMIISIFSAASAANVFLFSEPAQADTVCLASGYQIVTAYNVTPTCDVYNGWGYYGCSKTIGCNP